ncbi:MAG: hypothetical protein JW751_28945 [Polyangiaceae bacterium]|nr:hypothetical protein [Polyangiaceae bacterium]
MKTFIFDLDGTLAASKEPIADSMAERLRRLLPKGVVAIISGAALTQFERQVIGPVGPHEHLTLAPVTGAQIVRFLDGAWRIVAEAQVRIDRDRVETAFKQAFAKLGYEEEAGWGPKLEDRRFQVTWSALGQAAPGWAKKDWDPDFSRRQGIIKVLRELLPSELLITAGGATSIDIATFQKDSGIRAIMAAWAEAGVTLDDAVYVGDALFPGGNDYAAIGTGVRCVRTSGVEETAELIEGFVRAG